MEVPLDYSGRGSPAVEPVACGHLLRGRLARAARHWRPAPAGLFLGAAGQTICYHDVHDGSYCDIGGVNELPSRQTGSVGRSGDHRPGCARRGVRLAGRRDATSTVKRYSILPG